MNIITKIGLILLIALFSCDRQKEPFRDYIDLAGGWQFALDISNIGIKQKWYLTDLHDSINLPGTTDLNQKGFTNKDTTTMHLNRLYVYEGPAWYRRKILIPSDFENKHISLFLERTKSSEIWIDSIPAGRSQILQSPQVFDVSGYLTPGEHYITIRINNDLKLTPYGNVHIYTDETQTNWNGIIGKIFLESAPETSISNLRVFPDIDSQKIDIELEIANQAPDENISVEFFVEKTFNGRTKQLRPQKIITKYRQKLKLEYVLGKECSLWDEYEQPLYHLTAIISNGDKKDSKTVPFGMRKFTVNGTQFAINGRTVFLRGKHDAAVFPLTGFTPMNVEEWIRVFKIAKSYGINHYRFHSYCPPEAAFTAADMEGIYLQVELPFWGGLESESVAGMLKEEGFAMLKSYANHPSLVMFTHGNEIWSGHERVEKDIIALKAYDNRPLYSMGSNNNSGFVAPRGCSDFFVTARTPYNFDTVLTHTRLSQAFADSRNGGILNTQTPSTLFNFGYSVTHLNMPIIGHEIGQYQIYPDYREAGKYTGVLRAWNLEVFRHRMIKAGLIELDSAFHRASGAWSALCYKAEMEAAIRTKGFAGFQLLDLQDYPGQGTALVGILDAFMDSKNVITPDEWRESCNDVVLLLEFPKYCWTNTEDFKAKVVVANYSNTSLHGGLKWEIKNHSGETFREGAFADSEIAFGGLMEIGEISADLKELNRAEKLTIIISIPGTGFHNSYPLWVFPSNGKLEIPDNIIIKENLDRQTLTLLHEGAKVLLFPQTEDIQGKCFPGLFTPEFWNYGMFKSISEWLKKPVSPGTLGLLTNPEHPLFNAFPTDFHTNWQWFSIIKASNSLILDDTSKDYKPIVQIIDNLERNHKLGLIFEFKVGKGKLLVCMSQLNRIMDKPEAAQLYQSIINYMASDNFNPSYDPGYEGLLTLLTERGKPAKQ